MEKSEGPTIYNIESFFILIIKGSNKKEIILHIYKILQKESEVNSLDIKDKRELEMKTIITDEDWTQNNMWMES